ncbi:hydrogen peroxide-dependent heme synthase [Corynebacterium sphenisci]|uniref:hydrogen peroxide-dependent heme synthase n=1 Tax=Corynebacterium sphenisci TaxID=191493 RepID=UPI0026E0F9A9|nr:hydrogen peroxide-dependent heme synthase [Corynebacterium sphenisci]MDO5731684.1 chlorite dismutase family protein [Corynebacterium sphenisci]
MAKLDFDKLNKLTRYAMFTAYKVTPGALGADRAEAVAEARAFLDSYAEADLEVRGVYDITGLRAEADILFWVHAERIEDLQEFYKRFQRETALGRACTPFWSNACLHRPAEFNKSHLPSFVMGEEPGEYICVYPFVRSYDWYLMDAADRRRILAEHGKAGRDYPDVRANTVPSFALGDYEWILAFEGPDLGRIVELMWKMRYTEARLHVREEIPFFTGRRVADIGELVETLP